MSGPKWEFLEVEDVTNDSDASKMNRRPFLRKGAILAGGLTLGVSATGTAAAAAPNFGAGFWGDDERWGTKAVTVLPEPMNKDSLDKLFFIMHPDQDAPLSEAAPGNPDYNGGRWWSHTVTVDDASLIDFPITSYEELQNLPSGAVTITEGEANHPDFFACPLLPYRG
jgi:hypothetical protein